MSRVFYCLGVIFLFGLTFARAEWVSLHGSTQPVAPVVSLVQDDAVGTTLKIELSGFEVREFNAAGKTYQTIDLLTDIFTGEVGSPEVPYLATMLAVPDRGDVSVEVVAVGGLQKFSGYVLPPSKLSVPEGTPEPDYIENASAYNSSAAFPDYTASLDDPVVFRDFRAVRVSLYPVRYVPKTKELQVYATMTVRVKYGAGAGMNPRTAAKRAIPPSFGSVYRQTFANYESVLAREFASLEVGREVLLCIVPDTFATTFQPYKIWKHKSGTYVKVTKFSEIGANSSNPDIIKNYIAQCYHTWQYPPTFVLLVGDYGQIPVKSADGQSFANEDYYVEIDGGDVFPEAYIGRFTQDVNSLTGLQTIINKIMKYERTPYRANQDWFKHSVVCANNQYPTQPDTKRWVSDVMRSSGGFTVDTLLNLYGGSCVHNLTEVITAINSGRSFLNYRGEGSSSGWWASCYPFTTTDVSSVNNGEMLTFVTSIGCGVAQFNASGGNCFGEQWMELGTPSSTRGASAFCGPTWGNTHTKYNNAIDKGLYVAMFQEGLETPAQTLLRGKIRMYNLYGGADPYVLWHFRTYTVLGDPSTHIWKSVPRKVNVTYTPQISLGYDQVLVTVTDSATLAPVAGAEICIASDSVYVNGITDASGLAVISVVSSRIDSLTLLVRGVSVYPAEGSIRVVSDQEHVAPFGDPAVVDIDGNTDGKVNPNEHVQISYVMKNWGSQPSTNVQATLSILDTTYATVVNAGPISYGTLPPNGTASGSGTPMQFYIKPTAPIGTRLVLKVNITSDTHSWDYTTLLDVVGCALEYVSTLVDDQGAPHSNGRLDPGETALLYLTVTNTGQDIAPNVAGVLRCSDPYINILDSTGSFGSLAIGGSGTSTTNFFVVSVSPSCPLESTHMFTVVLSTQNGNYPYSVSRDFTLSVGLPSGTDPTGPDTYGYYAYSNDDSLYAQAPKFEWVEIRDVGTRVPYVQPGDFTVTASLPFTFKYYGRNYSNLRVSSDGWIAFGSGTQTGYTNYPIPHADNITNMVALFWDDLFEGTSNASSKLLYYNDAVNHRFVVEWDSVGHYSGTALRESFQAVLLDPAFYPTPTGDGEIIFQYRVVGEEGSCTLGIEDSTQTVGLQYLYNSVYASSATDIRDGTAIKWTTRPPSVNISNVTVVVPVAGGWNLVSNPVLRPDTSNNVLQLYPHALSNNAFKFVPGTGYVPSTTMPRGPGYWLKFPGGELNSILGVRVIRDSIPVSAGWNLIGSISSFVDTSAITSVPPGIRVSNYFGYDAGYMPVMRLNAGQGYWVKTNTSGQFILTTSFMSSQAKNAATISDGMEGFSSITITDAKGGSQTLYVGPARSATFDVSMFAMPPLPPAGAFDARFESAEGGTMLKTHPDEIKEVISLPIDVSSSAYPLFVEWKIAGGASYELGDASGGRYLTTHALAGSGSMKITSEAVQKLVLRVVGGGDVPREFALSQNYPNPFNPHTVINYALPVESKVTLKVFDLLGQEVRTLVNDAQPAGYKSMAWDSRSDRGLQVASGVYFARLDATGKNGQTFTHVLKMLLMK